MLGRRLSGYVPGTFRARRLGIIALASGRPDLLKPSPGLNQTRGYGTVVLSLRGECEVGDEPFEVLGTNPHRAYCSIHNTTNLELDGSESSDWVFKNGGWRTPDGETPAFGRLMYGIDHPARAGDPELEIGQRVRQDQLKGALSLKPIGTNGTRVRYFVAETSVFPKW